MVATKVYLGKTLKKTIDEVKGEKGVGKLFEAIIMEADAREKALKDMVGKLNFPIVEDIIHPGIVTFFRKQIGDPTIWARLMSLGASQDMIDSARKMFPPGWITGHTPISEAKVCLLQCGKKERKKGREKKSDL